MSGCGCDWETPQSRERRTLVYSVGRTTRVSNVLLTIPPMTTVARGRWTSAPTPVLMAMGMKPTAAPRATAPAKRSWVQGGALLGDLDR